jgi:ribonucleoside-diphosphate reductase beta chain
MEHIEKPEEGRYTMFPIKRWDEWQAYKKAQKMFWVEEEIDTELAKDSRDWKTLDQPIRHFLEHILAFFAVSDGVVNETLTEEIISRIQVREIKLWYDFQIMMEDIHNIVYSKLIDTYIEDSDRKNQLFHALEHYPSIRQKIEWVQRWLGKNNEIHKLSQCKRDALVKLEMAYNQLQAIEKVINLSSSGVEDQSIKELFTELHEPRPALARQILINVIMEGVFFSGSFCAIYWIYNTYGKLPGLSKANEFISRDEGMHTDFGIHIYRTLTYKLSQKQVHKIIKEAVEIESDFIRDALPKGLLGMNANLMTMYIQFVADQLLLGLGYDKCFGAENPFTFMNKQSIGVRIGDFFTDGNISEYGHHAAGNTVDDQTLDFSENFD